MAKTIRLMRALFLAVLVLVLDTTPCRAAVNRFFGPTSAGSNNGTSCANAYAWNDATNGWSTSNSQPAGGGNVLHICSGTYSLPANTVVFQSVSAGTSGSPNQLIADQGAATIQCSVCGSNDQSQAAYQFGQSYWIFDGGLNLTIQNSLNGATGATCPGGACSEITFTALMIGITASNITIQNMKQAGPGYTRAGFSDGGNDSSIIISVAAQNATIHNNVLTGAYNVLGTQGLSSNLTFDHNTVTACGHCFTIGMSTPNPTLTHVSVHDNHFHENLEYDSTTDEYHVNAMIIFEDSGVCSGCTITDLQLFNNLCDGTWSQHGFLNSCTFLDDQGSTNSITAAFYNNVDAIGDGQFGGPSGAEIVSQSQSAGSNHSYVLNNTVFQPTVGGTIPGGTCIHMENPQNVSIENNIFDSCGDHFTDNTATPLAPAVINGNVWFDAGVGSSSGWVYAAGPAWSSATTYGSNGVVTCLAANCATSPGQYYSLIGSNTNHNPQSTNGTDWMSFTGCIDAGCNFASWTGGGFDANGVYGDPGLNTSTYGITSTSNAHNIGANLTSLCSGTPTGGFTAFTALCQGAPQTFGQGGSCGSGCVPRPTTGPWDAGAFPVGGPSVSAPSLGPWTNTQVISTQTLTANSFSGTVTWSKLSGTQPTGLGGTCITGTTGNTCTLLGTLSAAGTFTFTIRATDGTNIVDTLFNAVLVNPIPSITTTSMPNGSVGVAYSKMLATSGGTGAITCALTSGSLPNGLSLTGSTCTIAGTPTVVNNFPFSITPTDSLGIAGTIQNLSITILGTCSITPTTVGPFNGRQTVNVSFSQTGCNASTFTVCSGSLSGSGLSLSTLGVLSGTAIQGTFNPTVCYDTGTDPVTVNILPSVLPATTSNRSTVGGKSTH